jgi:hypothetical protein
MQGYADRGRSATLLSLQVLLSLAPLHQQLVPSPEQLPLFPASFGPAVNKLLMAQLGMRQLLSRSVSSSGQPLMWHAWWHIGIRRYHWVKQQQQVDEDACSKDSQPSNSSKARTKQRARKQQAQEAAQQSGLQPLSAAQLTALYDDPAARYYAAGFAARQTAAYGTGLRANTALRSSHLAKSHSLWRAVSADRIQLLMGPQASKIGVERFDMLRPLLQLVCDEQYKHEHASEQPLFPPLLRPEGQLAVFADRRLPTELIVRETELRNRAGEAVHLMPGAVFTDVVEGHPAHWLSRHEALVPGCDVCCKPFSKQRWAATADDGDDSSSDDDSSEGTKVGSRAQAWCQVLLMCRNMHVNALSSSTIWCVCHNGSNVCCWQLYCQRCWLLCCTNYCQPANVMFTCMECCAEKQRCPKSGVRKYGSMMCSCRCIADNDGCCAAQTAVHCCPPAGRDLDMHAVQRAQLLQRGVHQAGCSA